MLMKNEIPTLLLLLFLGCNEKTKVNVKLPEQKNTENTFPKQSATQEIKVASDETIKTINGKLLGLLKDRKYKELSTYIHPEKGITFSMYANVKPKEDRTFSAEEFVYYYNKGTKFSWGTKDGSGETYMDTIPNYLSNWVWNKDYTKGIYELNAKLSHGNTLENIADVYPKAQIAVNYVKGTEANNEMDWGSLAFVFEEFKGMYYLVAIINDRWTI